MKELKSKVIDLAIDANGRQVKIKEDINNNPHDTEHLERELSYTNGEIDTYARVLSLISLLSD